MPFSCCMHDLIAEIAKKHANDTVLCRQRNSVTGVL
jgi:hypothetical protein